MTYSSGSGLVWFAPRIASALAPIKIILKSVICFAPQRWQRNFLIASWTVMSPPSFPISISTDTCAACVQLHCSPRWFWEIDLSWVILALDGLQEYHTDDLTEEPNGRSHTSKRYGYCWLRLIGSFVRPSAFFKLPLNRKNLKGYSYMTKCHLFPIVLRHQGLGFIMPAEKVTMAASACLASAPMDPHPSRLRNKF